MPFLKDVAAFINNALQTGSLNKAALQPAKYFELSTQLPRTKPGAGKKQTIEIVPAIITAAGISTVLVPESKTALQIYHRQLANVYSYEKKSHGNGHDVNQVSELTMVVISNSKLTKATKDALEAAIILGFPQHLSEPKRRELKLLKCLITPLGSNMDHVQVFRQEFPQSDYFLTEHVTMFSIKYRVAMTFDQSCADSCLCD